MYSDFQNTLKINSQFLINGCKVTAYDGTTLFTPDGVANYAALWTRDFSYMVEYAGDCITNDEIIRAVHYILNRSRKDGWIPDRVYADGTAVYAAGITGHPIGEANLDTALFLTFIIFSLYRRMEFSMFKPLFKKWFLLVDNAIDMIPVDPQTGLIYNDPQKPHSPYGFTDVVCKTGVLFYESLLYWRANRMLAEMLQVCKQTVPDKYAVRCNLIVQNIMILFDHHKKLFRAASMDCNQIDIWGNAYLLYINFPVSQGIKEAILTTLIHTKNQYIYKGQIRSLFKNEYWDRLLIDIKPEEYQNGAYWATASGWFIWCFAQQDKELALQLFLEVYSFLTQEGSFECVNVNYRKLPEFVVSTTNVYGALKRLESDKGFVLLCNH